MTKLDISLSLLLWDKDLCTDLVQSQQPEEKWNEKCPPLCYVQSSAHSSVWEKERPQKSLCNHSWAVNCLALCTVTPCCSSATRKGHPAPQSRGKGGRVSIIPRVTGSSRKCQCANAGTTLSGLPRWQQCSKSGSHWERTGLLYPLFVKLRLQRMKNHLFTGAKADECSTMHLAPDHSRAFPTFLSEQECWFLKNFHTDLGETRLPCPFSFCAAMDFCKTYLLGGLIPGS